MLGWSKGHVRMQKRDLFSLRFGSPETRLNIDPPGGGGEQNLTQLKTKRDFISQTPDPTKPMLGPMGPHTRHICLLTLLLNLSCASGMRTSRASECYKLGRPNVHSSNARMCTIRAAEETWGSECSHFLRASECAPFGRPSVHTSGVRMCTPWASDCAHLGLTHMHSSDVRTCTTRASECAHFGRCNLYFSGVRGCTLPASKRSQLGRANVHTSDVRMCTIPAPKCAKLVRPSVRSSSVRTCTVRASKGAHFACPNVHEPAAQRRRVTTAKHYCLWSP